MFIRGAPLTEAQFQDINVLNLPIYAVDKTPPRGSLPEAFFLHNAHHIVLAKRAKITPSSYIIIDSLPMTTGDFYAFFNRARETVVRAGPYSNRFWNTGEKSPAGPRALQYRPSSSTCALFAVAASLGVYFRPSVTDFWMWRVVAPILRKRPFPGQAALGRLSNAIVVL